MTRKLKRMTDMEVHETSGVYRPAHLQDGWILRKSTNPEDPMTDSTSTDDLDPVAKALADVDPSVADPVRKAIEQVQAGYESRLDQMTKALDDERAAREAEREARLAKHYDDMAASYENLPVSDAAGLAKALRAIDRVSTEMAKAAEPGSDFTSPMDVISELLTKADAALAEADSLFTDIGRVNKTSGAVDDLQKSVDALMAADPGLTETQATRKAIEANPGLYRPTPEKKVS